MIRLCLTYRGIAICLFLLVFSTSSVAQELRLRPLDEVQVSPDGQRVALAITESVETDGGTQTLTQIYLTGIDGSGFRRITPGPASNAGPRWSPDGKWIAFISTFQEMETLCLTGSNGKDRRTLTEPRPKITGFCWSPDGKRIAFVGPLAKRKSPGGEDTFGVEWGNKPSMTMSQLWIVPVDVEKNSLSAPRALTDTTRHVVYADLVTALDWSPDGSHIAFVHRPEQEGWELNDIATVDVRTGVITPLAQSAAAEITPFYSPDGRWIAYAVEAEGTFAFDILLTPVSGGPTRSLATTPGRWPTLIGWNPDSRSIYFIEEYGGFTRVCLLTTDGARHREIFQWDRTMNHVAMNASRTMIGFTAPAEYGRFFEAHAARLDRFRALSIRPRFRNLTRFRDNDR